MVLERERDGNFTKDRRNHGESNVWNTAQRQKTIYRFEADIGFE